MSDLIRYYENKALSLNTLDAFKALRAQGIVDLDKLGFPTRKVEAWKYSEPKAWSKHQFEPCFFPKSSPLAPIDGLHISFDKNHLVCSDSLPEGLTVRLLSELSTNDKAVLESYLGKMSSNTDGFHALNSALLALGLFIELAPGVKLDRPIVIHHYQNQDHRAHFWRHVIVLGEDTRAQIVEIFEGDNNSTYFTSAITETFLKSQAKLEYFKIQNEGLNAFHVGHTYAALGAHANIETHLLNLGGAWVRSDVSIELQEENAACLLNGIYLPGGMQHHDQHTTVFHQVPKCQSDEDYKGVISGEAQAVFDGRVVVYKDAFKTEAHQQNKNLLLSTKAQINTKPQLEIDTDDVVCSHGTTVGQLSEDALFYLATRGISRSLGKMLLISGFAHENLARIKDDSLRAYCETQVKLKLETAHGCTDI